MMDSLLFKSVCWMPGEDIFGNGKKCLKSPLMPLILVIIYRTITFRIKRTVKGKPEMAFTPSLEQATHLKTEYINIFNFSYRRMRFIAINFQSVTRCSR